MGDNHDDVIEKFYFSAAITNNTINPEIISYNVSRTQPILKNCEDWECSIQSFQIPSSSVPLFIFQQPSVGPDMSQGYWVGIQTAADLDPPFGISYVSVKNTSLGDNPQQIYNFNYDTPADSPYNNYIFDYQYFVQLVNVALATAWTESATPGGGAPPFIYYNSASSLFTIYSDNVNPQFNGTVASFNNVAVVKIYMNQKLYDFFRFCSVWNNAAFYAFDSSGPDYILNFGTVGTISLLRAPNQFSETVTYATLTQPYETLGLWTVYDRVLFTTSTLPVTNELQGNSVFGTSNQSLPILLSFNIPNDQKKDSSDYNYQPAGGFKWLSLLKQQSLSFFDINILMQGSDSGDTIPIYLLPGESVSFKLCFRLKSKLVRKHNKKNIR